MTKLIPPTTKKSQVPSTAADGQTTLEVEIFQDERELVRDNSSVTLTSSVFLPRVPHIEITFDNAGKSPKCE
jgi:molecular chaperone DnaK